MDFYRGLLQPDRWSWVVEHAGSFYAILIMSAAVTTVMVWLVLQMRYHRTIATLRFRLREFEDKLQGATADEARQRIESLQARLARLEPRRLVSRQKTTLMKRLTLPETAGMTDINICYDAACDDGKQYAADFIHLLGTCRGWRPISVTTFGSAHDPEAGLSIVSFKHGRTAAGANLLSKAFTEAGLNHEMVVSNEEQLELVITSRVPIREQHGDD
jgi:hypothetical protein